MLGGIFPPLTTPFRGDGALDTAGFERNLEAYAAQDLAGALVLGSNGEAASLDEDEKLTLVRLARARTASRTLLVGTGLESTRATISLTRKVADLGADAALVLTPSYYKSQMTQAALRAHFEAVADASPIPVYLYNVPANTGLDMPVGVAAALASHPNVHGMKDSAGNVGQLAELVNATRGARFSVSSGNFAATLPATTFGLKAAVLAVANVAPRECVAMLEAAFAGRTAEAGEIHLRVGPVARAVTTRFGVAGLKAAMDRRGLYGGPPRGPLLPLSADGCRELERTLEAASLAPI